MVMTLQVKRRVVGERDAHGNATITWADPVDWVVDEVAPTASMETTADNRDRSVITPVVYAPSGGNAPTEYDRVVYGGQDYEVDGRGHDWSEGPTVSQSAGGLVVALKRVEG